MWAGRDTQQGQRQRTVPRAARSRTGSCLAVSPRLRFTFAAATAQAAASAVSKVPRSSCGTPVLRKILAWNFLEVVTVTPLKPDLAVRERSASKLASEEGSAVGSCSMMAGFPVKPQDRR